MSQNRYASMMERLLANSIRVGSCLVWNGACSSAGYGRVSCRVKGIDYPVSFYVHRVAWELVNGPIPDGLHVDHLREEGICQFKACWELSHLTLLPSADNTAKARRFKLSKTDRQWMRAQGVQSSLL